MQALPITVLLLLASNVFMTLAWYAHLKNLSGSPWYIAAFVSWGIAFFEYCLMVPANRWGSGRYTATELKIIQEVVTLTVFSGFAVAYLGEKVRWNHIAAFMCIIAAVAFTFLPNGDRAKSSAPPDAGQSANGSRER